ncbi:TM2 domain-containing protein [Kangiella shandongensis]|uniref:hypothetical protein n=1 Tax=Kangiella shandongensis TaxID=2763258 RepID=UPI001CBB4E35|nr:hypothetical protein [Kangiella shandongensis]
MLNQQEVNAEEENLRCQVNALTAEHRKAYYREFKQKVKDPDTYAALNWFFIVGLHHFYLEKWGRGLLNILLIIIGVILLFTPVFWGGIVMILIVAAEELWSLFRSQVIVKDWNNQLSEEILKKYR